MSKTPQKPRGRARSAWKASTFAGGPGKKWTLIASWGLVVMLVIATAVAFWPAGGSDSTPSAGETSTPQSLPSSSAEPSQPASGQPCPNSTSTDARPTSAPADVRWEAAYGSTWPVSDTVGPTTTVNGIDRCYEHSPMGAALAAVNVLEAVRILDVNTVTAIVNEQVADGPGKQIMLDGTAAAFADSPPEERVGPRLLGFKIVSYAADEARIVCVEAWAGAPQYTGETVTMVWDDGDWKLRVDDQGRLNSYGTITVDPGSYLPWAF